MAVGIVDRVTRIARVVIGQWRRIAIVAFACTAQRGVVPAECVIFEDVLQTVAHNRIVMQRIDECDALVHIMRTFGRHQRRYVARAAGIDGAVANIAFLRFWFAIAIAAGAQFAVALGFDVARHHIRFIQFTRASPTNQLLFVGLDDAIAAVFHEIRLALFAHIQIDIAGAIRVVRRGTFEAIFIGDRLLVAIIGPANGARLRIPRITIAGGICIRAQEATPGHRMICHASEAMISIAGRGSGASIAIAVCARFTVFILRRIANDARQRLLPFHFVVVAAA